MLIITSAAATWCAWSQYIEVMLHWTMVLCWNIVTSLNDITSSIILFYWCRRLEQWLLSTHPSLMLPYGQHHNLPSSTSTTTPSSTFIYFYDFNIYINLQLHRLLQFCCRPICIALRAMLTVRQRLCNLPWFLKLVKHLPLVYILFLSWSMIIVLNGPSCALHRAVIASLFALHRSNAREPSSTLRHISTFILI